MTQLLESTHNARFANGAGAVAATPSPIRSYHHHCRSATANLGSGASADRTRARAADRADRLHLFAVDQWSDAHHGPMIGLSALGRWRHRSALRLPQLGEAEGAPVPPPACRRLGAAHLSSSMVLPTRRPPHIARGDGRQGPWTSAPARWPPALLILRWRTPEIPIADQCNAPAATAAAIDVAVAAQPRRRGWRHAATVTQPGPSPCARGV